MIAIIDYGMGNVRSVFNAVEYTGHDAVITADQDIIDRATHIILPGVGAFGDAVTNLHKRNLVTTLEKQVLRKGKPLLGICLGMQILGVSSDEHGSHKGLGWINAKVKKFEFNSNRLKTPHVGWNEIQPLADHPILMNLTSGQYTFYFVHSHCIVDEQKKYTVATCEYGCLFSAVVATENIVATQFHPEKSQDNGIQIFKNFVNWKP